MTHLRCCDDPANMREGTDPDGHAVLWCIACGTVLATADDRGELFADL